MGEQNTAENNSEENVDDQEQENDNSSDDNKNTEENKEDDNAGKGDDENDDGNQEGDEKKEKPSDEKDEGDDNKEPQIRVSKQNSWKNKYFAEKRLANKKQDKSESDNEGDKEEDEIAPEDEEMVGKVIRKQYGNKFDQMDAQADKSELKEFISDNPDFKPYQAKILKFLQHPSRNHLPIQTVALEAVGLKNLIKFGAKIGKKADDRARKESGGGHSTSRASGEKKVADMSDKEFDAEVEKVKRS